MELVFLLITILALIWGFNKFRAPKNHTKFECNIVKEGTATTAQDIESRELATTHEKNNRAQHSVNSRASAISATEPSIKDKVGQDQSVNSFGDDDLYQMLEAISTFRTAEVFSSVSTEEKLSIRKQLEEHSAAREQNRYARLELAEFKKQKTINELEAVEFAIAENDDWFVAAKEGEVDVTPESLKQHRRKAEELYARKRTIIDNLLPEADSKIKTVISKIESEEMQEMLFQRRDLERLLLPFHEERERARRQVIVAHAKERMRQREEEEARRQKEYEAPLNRLRAEKLEKSRFLAEERRKKRVEGISARADARKIPYLLHFTPIANVESILEHGLKSRNALANRKYIFTDGYRSDGWLDWISLSVSFPNYKMFYAKKNSLNDVDGWAILIIKRDALWELDCKFILTNAASFEIRMFRDDKWSSVEAFEDMFNYAEHRNGIPDYFTTDPQAEVMIRNEVPKNYIGMIAVERQADLKRLGSLEGVRVETIPELFKWRSDFEHWRKFRLSPFPSGGKTEARF